jgi:hypothetical protein
VGGVGGIPPRLIALGVLVIGAIALAWLKPWGGTTPVHVQNGLAGFAVATQAPPTDDPVIHAAILRELCNQPADWRLISMETSALGDTRTMYGISPAAASGPDDPSIPTARVYASRLFGIGVCSPHAGANPDLPSPVEGVTIWFAPPTGSPTQMDQGPILDTPLNNLGEAYFGPPRTETDPQIAGNSNPTWPAGHYAVQIDRGDANGMTLWFALDFAPQIER